ncbi:MAG: hypothetical protein ACREQ5_09305 [Candidatus Dormibacteria bacterium]
MTNFIDLAQAGKATDFQEILAQTMGEKIATALDTQKAEIASKLFGEEIISERAKMHLHIQKGAFHQWLGKSEDEPITDADIEKGLAAGGHPAHMASFAKAAKTFHHK